MIADEAANCFCRVAVVNAQCFLVDKAYSAATGLRGIAGVVLAFCDPVVILQADKSALFPILLHPHLASGDHSFFASTLVPVLVIG